MAETVFKRWNQEFTLVGAGILFLLPLFSIEPKTYLTLTIAGLAMGMLLFLVASGVSIIFGLMDVLNFAHGALFAWGAYVGFTVFQFMMPWVEAHSVLQNVAVFLIAVAASMVTVAVLGIILERVVVRRVYGNHLFQILITFGSTIVLVELIRVFWGPNDEVMTVPFTFSGNWDIMDVIVSRYRIICIFIGALVYGVIQLILKENQTGDYRSGGCGRSRHGPGHGAQHLSPFYRRFCRGCRTGGPGWRGHEYFQPSGVPGHGRDLSSFRVYRGDYRGPWKRDRLAGGGADRGAQLQLCGLSGSRGPQPGQMSSS